MLKRLQTRFRSINEGSIIEQSKVSPVSLTDCSWWLTWLQLNKMYENTLKNMICFGWPSLQQRELIEFCNLWLGGWKGCLLMRLSGRRGKRQELKRAVETSTLSVRVNTSSDVGNKSVWGAHSHGSKHGNNKRHAMRLNTMDSLRAECCGAKLLVQGCRLYSSASSAMNERSRKRFNQT